MSSVTTVTILLAFVTSPLQARALGPAGRGDLAAIIVVLGLAPSILDFGLAAFVARERARGTDTGALFGTMLGLSLVFSLLGMAAAIPVGHLIGHGRRLVTLYVEIGLWLSPINVVVQTLGLTALAERRWGLVNRLRVTSPVLTALAFVILYALGRLTVGTAAFVTLAAGLLTGVQLLPMIWRTRSWTVRTSLIAPGLHFGARSWIATILGQSNGYLDQLMMTGLTSARQLGLYAVATTVSSVSGPMIVAPFAASRFADVANGMHEIVPRLCRQTLLAVVALGLIVAAAGPFAIELLFGGSFTDAIPMLLILLISSVPAAVGGVLIQMLAAAGNPQAGLRAQAASLIVTIPLLLVVLSPYGGLGASVVDTATNLVVGLVAVRYARTDFGGSRRDYWVPRGEDTRTVLGRIRARWLRMSATR
jgi:O-antigen/teichoic acid export membrane protein